MVKPLLKSDIMQTFKQLREQRNEGTYKPPVVSMGSQEIDFFIYQFTVIIGQLKLISKGLSIPGVRLKDIKAYYEIKGRTASDLIPKVEELKRTYLNELNPQNN